MSSLDLAGVGTFVLISIGFYFIGPRMIIFNMFCLAILAGLLMILHYLRPHSSTFTGEAFVLFVGLLLYWFGLLAVRTMLERSVSLNLLKSYVAGRSPQSLRSDVAGRLGDAQRHRLIKINGSILHLTRFGFVVSSIVTILYHVLRINE